MNIYQTGLIYELRAARYVKKPAGAKPGMVIYTTYQTMYVAPDAELAKKLHVK